jgi:hypothetical protein
MMIALAALTVLTFAAFRFAYAGLLFGVCLTQEREQVRYMEEANQKATTSQPPFDRYDKDLAAYHAQSAAYHSRRKWLYLRAMFEFWDRIPNPPPEPDLVYPEVPYVPPPKPLPSRAGDRNL